VGVRTSEAELSDSGASGDQTNQAAGVSCNEEHEAAVARAALTPLISTYFVLRPIPLDPHTHRALSYLQQRDIIAIEFNDAPISPAHRAGRYAPSAPSESTTPGTALIAEAAGARGLGKW
jgi:hypothetical protein